MLVAQTPYAVADELIGLLESADTYRPPVGLVQRWLETGGEGQNDQHSLVEELIAELRRLDGGAPTVVPVGSALTETLLAAWVAQRHDVQTILFHTAPEKAMAVAMEQGVEPTAALHQWGITAAQLLRVHRRNRVRSRVINVDRALSAPSDFLRVCRQHLGLGLAAVSESAMPDVPAGPSRQDPVYELIAAQMVAQSDEALDLARELDASALPIGQRFEPGHADCLRAYEAINTVRGELAGEREARQAAEETVQRLENELTEQRNKRDNEPEARESAESRAQELKQENEEMLAQLHQVQEELEAYFIRSRDEEKKRKAAEKRLKERDSKAKEFFQAKKTQQARAEHYRNRLAAVHKSTSWKVTTPLRVIKRLVTGRPLRSRKKPAPKVPANNA